MTQIDVIRLTLGGMLIGYGLRTLLPQGPEYVELRTWINVAMIVALAVTHIVY